MNKLVLSAAIVALLGGASGHRHHHKLAKRNHHNHRGNSYVQFIDFEDNDESQYIDTQSVPVSQPVPGVILLGSDPIHGSLGPKKAKHENLTPEQQFEQDQRNTPAAVYEDEYETVGHTNASIKAAEAIVGAKFPEPTDPKQKKKTEERVKYPQFDSDDEDEDTVETRRSVKTAEKQLQTRFFINAKDQRDYEKKAVEGRITAEELSFNEDKDHEIGSDPVELKKKEQVKKEERIKQAIVDVKKAGKTPKQLKEEEKAAEEEQADKDSKTVTEEEKNLAKGGNVNANTNEGKEEGKKSTEVEHPPLPPIPELDPNFGKGPAGAGGLPPIPELDPNFGKTEAGAGGLPPIPELDPNFGKN